GSAPRGGGVGVPVDHHRGATGDLGDRAEQVRVDRDAGGAPELLSAGPVERVVRGPDETGEPAALGQVPQERVVAQGDDRVRAVVARDPGDPRGGCRQGPENRERERRRSGLVVVPVAGPVAAGTLGPVVRRWGEVLGAGGGV